MNRATSRGGGRGGWLDGANLNGSRLDLFYWVVAVVSPLGLLNFLYWANKYRYRHDPCVAAGAPVDEDSDA